MAKEFSVLTYNTWLLSFPIGVKLRFAKDYDSRLKQLPEHLARTGADIICLQEVWLASSQQYLVDHMCAYGYRYHSVIEQETRFYWGRPQLAGSGLMIFSKSPLVYQDHMRFSTYTRADEAFVAKGALKAEVEIEKLGTIDVVTAHLGAVSFNAKLQTFESTHIEIRRDQVKELIDFIQNDHKMNHTILGVDLNTHYFDDHKDASQEAIAPEYKLITEELNFIDTYVAVNGFKNPPDYTLDANNQYYANGFFTGAPSQVVDYVMLGKSEKKRQLKVKNSQLVFTGDHRFPILSDHYGVLTKFSY